VRQALMRCWRSWRDLRRFSASPPEHRKIVFYSEGTGYWRYFRGVIQELLAASSLTISYVTSDPADPLLETTKPRLATYYIGRGSAMAAFFQSVEARVVVMTMPDLETFHIKRSRTVGQYVYLHHSIVSTHMVYRKAAFDHFDSILCVGPHHVEETREWEAAFGLPQKQLVPHGYGLLDDMMASPPPAPANRERKTILVAPWWGREGLLESYGLPLCRCLLDSGHRVVVRPHPRSVQLAPHLIPDLQRVLGRDKDFVIDSDREGWHSLVEADVMISDWSGVAFEYAFGLLRPVVFVDTPRKVNNPEYERLHAVPFEVQAREKVGRIVVPGRWDEMGEAVSLALSDGAGKQDELLRQREKSIFNVGTSASAATGYLLQLAR